ncbi:MAG: alpha/beta hydrolase-fold protein [Saprospiraceae bacterium]|nr:alpha/beta hydrolase-fold protein [Saprospiraceae bacterium]
MKNFLLPVCFLFSLLCQAQNNVRAWYADGQVWVVWEITAPLPIWYEIYARPTTFSSVNDAVRVGKLHLIEYTCAALKEQIDTTATPRIPGPQGNTFYQLALNEGLFVFTPHQAGNLFFAVVAENETTVTAQNRTPAAVPFQYDPSNDPVECHLQAVFPSPFANGFTCFAFLMWSDGRQNQWDNRPDFPVTANAAKNGMPSLFFVSAPAMLDTTQPLPLSVWLHGGGGTARQSLAGSRPEINIRPAEGLLLSHNDDLVGWRGPVPPNFESPSWHFGYRKNYDPFSSNNLPATADTLVNYTQRRYLWIDFWLVRRFNVDPNRIHIHGHSMGSAGALALAKCYPEHYASVTLFNTGCGGPEPGSNQAVFGDVSLNFPTNLKNREGETVRQLSLWNFLDNCSPSRDLPLIRHWHGKNDDNGTMQWDAYVVENYRKADSLGIGIQHFWSERAHGVDTSPDYGDHWISGVLPSQQTVVDNVSFPEGLYRSNQSFPAFFNHRQDPQNNDPGTGIIGINNGDGDNWGAWGGWHRWDADHLVDDENSWEVSAWLNANALFANDICPHDSLVADVAIRRPQLFNHPGSPINWWVSDAASNEVLQTGFTLAGDDGLVVLDDIVVYREDIRRVRIRAELTSSIPTYFDGADLKLCPNPAKAYTELVASSQFLGAPVIRIIRPDGTVQTENIRIQPGENRIALDVRTWPGGVYFISIAGSAGLYTLRLVVTK